MLRHPSTDRRRGHGAGRADRRRAGGGPDQSGAGLEQLREDHARAAGRDHQRRPAGSGGDAGQEGPVHEPQRPAAAERPDDRHHEDGEHVQRVRRSRGGPADGRAGPELRAEQVGLHLLLAARTACHDGQRPAGRPYPTSRPGNSPSTMPATTTPFDEPSCYPLAGRLPGRVPDLLAAVEGLQPALALQVERRDASRWTCRPSRRSSGSTPSAASAATSAPTSRGTPRATCTSRPATTRPSGAFGSRRPGADERRHAGRQPGRGRAPLARATRTTCAARSCASRSRTTSRPGEGLGKSYTVPEGNLREYTAQQWPAIAAQAGYNDKFRPEIYVMGLRNPFRIDIDKETDELSVGRLRPRQRQPDPAARPDGRRRVAGHRQAR